MVKISIIVPHYQKQVAFLEAAPNLFSQLMPGDEVIVVDDWSPGGFTIKHPQLRIIKPPKIRPHIYRLSTLRNFGLEAAVNDTCLILDPDCKLEPGFLDKVRKSFNSACVYGCRIDFQREDGGVNPDPRMTKKWHLGWMIWGGCILFSKSRTGLARVDGQWFLEEFNGRWGVEENDFANRCYHSGMVLVYATELKCIHLYHPRKYDGIHENTDLAVRRLKHYQATLDQVSDYKPRVGVLVVTLMRPDFLAQCLYSLARVTIPIRIYLVNQSDKSRGTMSVVDRWKGKWSVVYKENDKLEGLAAMKRWGMEKMKEDGLEYIVIVDDDVCLMPGGLEALVSCADNNPRLHSISGWLDEGNNRRMLGGNRLRIQGATRYPRLDLIQGLTEVEWVGGGFTLHRLDPLILHDPAYMIGLEDFDYANHLKKLWLKSAVFSEAGAWHKLLLVDGKVIRPSSSSQYQALRMSGGRIQASKDHFEKKWGYEVR